MDLPRLQTIATDLGLTDIKGVEKQALIYQILDRQAESVAGMQKEKEAQKSEQKRRGPGRPPKNKSAESAAEASASEKEPKADTTEKAESKPAKRRPGRPKKNKAAEPTEAAAPASPAKAETTEAAPKAETKEEAEAAESKPAKRRPGRPKKSKSAAAPGAPNRHGSARACCAARRRRSADPTRSPGHFRPCRRRWRCRPGGRCPTPALTAHAPWPSSPTPGSGRGLTARNGHDRGSYPPL